MSITSMDDFADMNDVWDAWVDPANTPARACVESPRLATPDYHVEIMVVAAKQDLSYARQHRQCKGACKGACKGTQPD